jgi:hypothetical protein
MVLEETTSPRISGRFEAFPGHSEPVLRPFWKFAARFT